MKKLFLILSLVAYAFSGRAATYQTVTLTITAAPPALATVTFNGSTRTWSNQTTATLILTNGNVNFCATNLFNALVDYPLANPRPNLTWENTNAIGLRAAPMAVTVSAGWATVTTASSNQAVAVAYTVPIDGLFATNRTNNASDVAYGLGKYSTNPISGIRLTNTIGFNGTVHQATNGYYTNSILDRPFITNGLSQGTRLTNAIGLHGTNYSLYGGLIDSATISNALLTNVAVLQGYLLALTNGLLDAARLTNIASFDGTMRRATNGYYTNSILDRPTSTNLVNRGNAISSPGTGTETEQLGTGAQAIGSYALAVGRNALATNNLTTAIGNGATATNDNGLAVGYNAKANWTNSVAVGPDSISDANQATAIGPQATASHANSVAVGYKTQTTTSNEIALGRSGFIQLVTVAGRLAAGSHTNNQMTGTNIFLGAVGWSEVVVSSFANGVNIAAPATNKFIRLVASGPTAAFSLAGITGWWDGRELIIWNDTGQAFTLLHESGLDPTPANRIYSTSQGDIVFPTNSLFSLIYSPSKTVGGSSGRWIYGAANTNSTLANNSVTDGILRDSAALSVIGRSANSSGDPGDIAAGADGLFLGRSNSTLGFFKVGLTNASIYNVNPVGQSAGQVLAWDGTSTVWSNRTLRLTNDFLSDVKPIGQTNRQMLAWDDAGKYWTNVNTFGGCLQLGNFIALNPLASTTYYYSFSSALVTTYTSVQVKVPKACRLKRVEFKVRVAGTLASSQTVSQYIRINDTTDVAQVDTTWDAANREVGVNVDQALAQGDLIAGKIVTPAWGTAPTSTQAMWILYLEEAP